MDNLLHLYLVDPNKDIFAVFDSSYLASAGFFYQKYGEEKKFIKIFSRRRSDSNNKFKPSSCYLEFSGILAGMLGAQVEIERCLKKIIITTDSKNVADLFNKMKNDMVPSTDRKINEIFSKLCNFNYEINYVSCSSPAIEFADYISRTPAASIPCSGCSICEAVESKDNFFNHVRTISSQVGLYKFETELMPTMTYENFERLQLPVSTSGLNQELTHPFSDRGWQNSLVAKPDLSSLSEDHDSMLMAQRIGRKIIDEKLTVHDILSNEKLLDDWQNSDSNIRKAKVCIKEGRDPPNKLETVRTLVRKKDCRLRNRVLVRYFRSEVHNVITKIFLPEKFNTQIVFTAHNSHGHGAISRLEKVLNRLFTCTGYKEQVRIFVLNVRVA